MSLSAPDSKKIVVRYKISKKLVKLKCKDNVNIYVARKILMKNTNLFDEFSYKIISINLFDSDVVCYALDIIVSNETTDYTITNIEMDYYITPEFGIKVLECLDYLDVKKFDFSVESVMDRIFGSEYYLYYLDYYLYYSKNKKKPINDSGYDKDITIKLFRETDKIIKYFLEYDVKKIKSEDYSSKKMNKLAEELQKWTYEGQTNEEFDNNPNLNREKLCALSLNPSLNSGQASPNVRRGFWRRCLW